jgi:NADH-quinone oxidoreductase subunit H
MPAPELNGSTSIIITAIKAAVLLGVVSFAVLVLTYMERKVLADIQVRLGPMETGGRALRGILQPVADGIKLLCKEDIIPSNIDKWTFILAPVVVFVPTFLMMVPVPLGESLVFVDMELGLLFILAVSTLPPLGVMMAGWSSRNKYTLISALRSAAQMITYEIPLVLAVLSVVMVTGSLNPAEIVQAQKGLIFGIIPCWNIFLIPLGFFIFYVGSLAEIGRTPFDLLEAESEIVTGYNIEYSGMRFAFFMFAEYIHLFIASVLMAIMFLGGWIGPVLPGTLWLLLKTFVIIYTFIWVRGTLPRVRIDQLMGLGWKFLIPLGLANIGIVGAARMVMA